MHQHLLHLLGLPRGIEAPLVARGRLLLGLEPGPPLLQLALLPGGAPEVEGVRGGLVDGAHLGVPLRDGEAADRLDDAADAQPLVGARGAQARERVRVQLPQEGPEEDGVALGGAGLLLA